jgi:hypothetical protein
MDGEVDLRGGPVLRASLPAIADLAVVRDGETVRRARSDYLEYRPESSGAFRVEAYQLLAGEPRPWIYSNPIYVLG